MIAEILLSSIGITAISELSRQYLLKKVENEKDTILHQFPNTTILLPTLNEEWMIEKTLQSIKNQNIYKSYPYKFEILIVDSNSKDKTIEIAKNYVDKIINIEERNLVKARTIGVDNAKGDLIVFIDADMIYPINWLNSMLKHYTEDLQVVAVSGLEFHPNFNKIVNLYEPLFFNLATKLGYIYISPMIGHNSSVYKWAFNMISGFSVPFEYDIKSDTDLRKVLETHFTEKLKTVGKYVYDPQLIAYDYGGKRRVYYKNRHKLYNKINNQSSKINQPDYQSNNQPEINNQTNNDIEEKYLSRYWKEREQRIRF